MNDRDHSNHRDDALIGPSRSGPLPDARGLTASGQIIDRLVAGDLDEVSRREVLDWLDEEPGRWRHCGLAFLEAQLWKESFSRVVGRAHSEPSSQSRVASSAQHARSPRAECSKTRAQPPAHRSWPSLRALTAVAAAVLVAFGLGSLAGSAWPWSVIRDGGSAQETKHVTDSTSARTAEMDLRSPEGIAASTDEMPQDQPRPSPVQTFAVLKVATESAGTREIHLPVLEGPASNERWLRPEPEALPDHVLRQLERCGYQLQQQRRFLEVELEDGRHAVIPVDRYQVKFVGSLSS